LWLQVETTSAAHSTDAAKSVAESAQPVAESTLATDKEASSELHVTETVNGIDDSPSVTDAKDVKDANDETSTRPCDTILTSRTSLSRSLPNLLQKNVHHSK
jgi:hypothetical protein